MSKQLTLSAAIAVLGMALFAVSSGGAGPDSDRQVASAPAIGLTVQR